MSFMFSEPLIIIDDQWLRKHEAHWRFIDEAVPYSIDFIANIFNDVVHWFFQFFLFRHVHVRTAVGTACGTKKNKTKVCTFWNENE